MTDFFGSVRNVELHNGTSYYHSDERYDHCLCTPVYSFLHFFSITSHDTIGHSHDAEVASLINEDVNFVSIV